MTEALGHLFSDAVIEQNLRVAGTPKIEAADSDSETHLKFSAVFEVYPEIVLNDLTEVVIERPVLEIGSAEIDNTIGSAVGAQRTRPPGITA